MENLAPFFPKSSYTIGITGYLHAIRNRKVQFQLVDRLFSFVQLVHRQSYNTNVFFLKRSPVSLIIGQLPTAVWSPTAPVEEQRRIFPR